MHFADRRRAPGDEVRYLYGAAIVLAAFTVGVYVWGSDNGLALGLLQAMTLFFTVWASVRLGEKHAAEAAKESLRPQATVAFRRVKQLFAALGRQRDAIDDEVRRLERLRRSENPDVIEIEHALTALMTVRYLVTEQISTADDAVADWRDIIPDEVEAIKRAAEGQGLEVNE